MSTPYKTECSRRYRAAHDSGPRKASEIRNIVLHSTEGPTAEGAAVWFTNPKSGGSANLVIDSEACFRTLPDLQIPWGAPGCNTQGFHVEMAGYARWTRAEWKSHRRELERAAYKCATRCLAYKIPVRWVGPVGLRLGRRGLTTHADVSKAYPLLARRYGAHTDPGAGFPKDTFLMLVKQFLDQLNV